jgi:antibiotic biosynthesis monooxygenase (ABM) superfamily enzyme
VQPVSLVVSLWIRGDDIGAFEAFEQAAAEVMSKYGGRIETVIRCSDFEAGPFEVHIVTFPDVMALDAYRQDPRVAELRPLRERVISRTEVWSGEQRHPYGPAPELPC